MNAKAPRRQGEKREEMILSSSFLGVFGDLAFDSSE